MVVQVVQVGQSPRMAEHDDGLFNVFKVKKNETAVRKKHMDHLVLCINFHLYKKQKYKLLQELQNRSGNVRLTKSHYIYFTEFHWNVPHPFPKYKLHIYLKAYCHFVARLPTKSHIKHVLVDLFSDVPILKKID